MPLLQLWYQPGRVFSRIERSSWILPLAASMVLILVIKAFLVSVVGMSAVLHTARERDSWAAGLDSHALTLVIIAGVLLQAILSIVGVAAASAAIYAVLRITAGLSGFAVVFGVCSYVAYARKTIDLALAIITVCYNLARYQQLPAKGGLNTGVTTLGAVLPPTIPELAHRIAQSIDLLEIGALILTIFGLTRAFQTIGFRTVALAVGSAWITWIALSIART